jgi:tetratricopeptide (TPR) repeat protein
MPRLAHLTVLDRPSKVREAAPAALLPGQATRYFAFLSYSHSDDGIARWLHSELEHFRVPDTLVGRLTENGAIPKRLSPVFRDRGELAASDDLGEEIRSAIHASRFLVVLCSPAAARSRWANAEVEAFKRGRPQGCVFAAIVDGEPFASDIPGREAEECLPRALRFHYDRRGRPTARRAEPMAADLRDHGDGRRMGFLKIVAGMLGVGLDELVQRDTMRRQRRMGMVAAASLAGMAVTSTLAVTAIHARDAASEQRRAAEGLVGFMLGDLRDKLEPIGRLDALDAVGSRALGYFEGQDKAELTDEALAQRSQALALLAQIATARGDTDGALRRYAEAMAGTAEMIRRSPDDPQRLFDHAQNVFYVGEIARGRGELDKAEAAMRNYKSLADRMVALDPENTKWRMETKYADTNLGIILYAQRRYPEASRQLQQALRTMESLAAADPGDQESQRSLVDSLGWLADSQSAEGHLDEAIATRERQAALVDALDTRNGGDVQYRKQAIAAHRALARQLMFKGDADSALKQGRTAVDIAQQLVPREPDNTTWLGFAANAQIDLGRFLIAAGKWDEAATQVRGGCDLAERLSGDTTVLRRQLAYDCLSQRAGIALHEGSGEEARGLAERAVAAARDLRSGDVAEDRMAVGRALKLVGDVEARFGDRNKAVREWRMALSTWPSGIPLRPQDLATEELLLERTGQGQRAAALKAQLDSMGFRAPNYIHERR